MDNVQPGGGEDDMSDCKMRAGTTYSLEVERQSGVSVRSCDHKTREKTTYSLEVKCQIAVERIKRGQG
jgi:hypothetical protein